MKLGANPLISATHLLALFTFLSLFINSVCSQYNIDLVSTLGNPDGQFSFVNETEGFHFSDNQILKTVDAGHTWDVLLTDITALTHDEGLYMNGCFVTSDIGWVVLRKYDNIDHISDSSFLYKTIDAGITWDLQHVNPPNSIAYAAAVFMAVHFKDEQNGWVYGNGLLEQTTDGGANWTTIVHHVGNTSNDDVIRSLTFSDNTTAYAVGYGSWIQKSADAGTTWSTQHYYPGQGVTDDYYIYDIAFSPNDSDLGIAAISDGIIKRTTNGGVLWEEILTGYPHSNNAMAISPGDGSIWSAAGDYCNDNGCFWSSGLLYSNDDGMTWNHIVDSPISNRYSDVVWPSAEYGVTCNKNGEIYRISFEDASVNHSSPSDVFSVYPNPAQNEITINLDEAVAHFSILNTFGQTIVSQTSNNSSSIDISLEVMEPGIYFIEVFDALEISLGKKRFVKIQ